MNMICKKIYSSDVSLNFIENFNKLSSELSGKKIKYSSKDIEDMLKIHNFIGIFINKNLVGYIVIVKMSLPQGKRVLLESFIIDKNHQNKGLGKALLTFCINSLKEEGFPHVNLTCNPSREIAQKLYLNMCFKKVETNVFRYYF